ncbi:MAG TPA: hydroxyacylglutathione hydrolase [Piscirickettsiaceae bacterium]|nr:hydroxyacylglutathione hydrolase [Piscirickettsiaceae bacterium]
MQIHGLRALDDNYIWLLQHDKTAWVVDPGDATVVLTALENLGLHLHGILITHHHYDHTQGVTDLLDHLGPMPVYGPVNSRFDAIDQPLKEGDRLALEGWILNVLQTPGHTLDHISFVNSQAAFTGDTLFTAGCGRLFEGTAEQMAASLKKLRTLPDDTLVYCGHEYTWANIHFAAQAEPDNPDILTRMAQTIANYKQGQPCVPAPMGLEKATNPFLRFDHAPLRQTLLERGAEETDASLFATLRAWKDNLDATGELEPKR